MRLEGLAPTYSVDSSLPWASRIASRIRGFPPNSVDTRFLHQPFQDWSDQSVEDRAHEKTCFQGGKCLTIRWCQHEQQRNGRLNQLFRGSGFLRLDLGITNRHSATKLALPSTMYGHIWHCMFGIVLYLCCLFLYIYIMCTNKRLMIESSSPLWNTMFNKCQERPPSPKRNS